MDFKIEVCPADIRNRLYEAGKLEQKENIVMLVHGWVLLENRVENIVVYKAVNIFTLEDVTMFRRKRKIDITEYRKVALQLCKLGKRPAFQELNREQRAVSLLTYIFDYILPVHGFTFRESQKDLSLHMLRALQRNKLALCEAEVGTGKTHAYLVAAIVYNLFAEQKKPVIISTSTIALQEAITKDYIPQLSYILRQHRIIEESLSYVVRKGKNHYVCDQRLRTYKNSVQYLGEDRWLIEFLDNLQKADYLHIDMDKMQLSPYVKKCIGVINCSTACPIYFSCRYITYLKKCRDKYHDFQITNHNFIFAEILGNKAGKEKRLPDYGIIVLDEAHKIKEVARQMYCTVLPITDVASLLGIIKPEKFENSRVRKEISVMCNTLSGYENELLAGLNKEVLESHENDIMYGAISGKSIIVAVFKKLEKQICAIEHYFSGTQAQGKVRLIIGKCRELESKLLILSDVQNNILWAEKNINGIIQFCTLPKNLEKILYKDIWNTDVKKILTSGTLSVKGNFTHFKRTTGIQLMQPEKVRVTEISKFSPFDFALNAILYIPERMPFPDIKDDNYILVIKKEIMRLIQATAGHTMILFTSYRFMEKIYYQVRNEITEYPLFMMGKGQLDALEKYKKSGNGVLFASDSAGEGVDLPGDILSSLIIVKLPFPVPDPIMQFEQHAFQDFRSYMDAVIIPEMLLKLRQWIGRGIRKESDTTAFTILDCRAGLRGRYRQNILDILPEIPVTDSIHDVCSFITEKKEKEYFKGWVRDE